MFIAHFQLLKRAMIWSQKSYRTFSIGQNGLFQKLEAPPKEDKHILNFKKREFPGSNFDLKKMRILKIVFKMGILNFLCQK